MKTYTIFSIIAVTSLSITGCSERQNTKTANDLASPVSVMELTTNSIKKFNSTTGTAMSNAQVDLKSEMAGAYQLQKNPRTGQPYKLGDMVKKGDVIVKFEDQEYDNGIAIESKKLTLELAEQDLIKQKALYEKGGVTLTDIQNAEIKITSSKYDYENGLLSLAKKEVKAPFDGVIIALPHYTENVKIESGQPIVSIMDYSKMYMEINLPESALNSVKTGQPAYITHYTLDRDTIRGMVSQLSPAISTETRTFQGVITIDNRNLKLRPGMFVKADIVVDQADGTIVIPKEVVLNHRNRRYVYVVEKNLAKVRNLRVGLEDDDNIEVLEGLQVGDNLIIRGYETLREDSKVKVQK